MDKLDYKKEYKDLYMPSSFPTLVDVPSMNFIAVNGTGDPNGEEYQQAVGILYALAFTIKMSKMKGEEPAGYFEYVVPPLEGLWSIDGGEFDFNNRKNWCWKSMIRQPEFVTKEVFNWAVAECKKKKPNIDVSKAKFITYTEGLAVQVMHNGPYSTEPESVDKMKKFMTENNLIEDIIGDRPHHEIYLSDPRKTDPIKLKTVIRHPVKKGN